MSLHQASFLIHLLEITWKYHNREKRSKNRSIVRFSCFKDDLFIFIYVSNDFKISSFNNRQRYLNSIDRYWNGIRVTIATIPSTIPLPILQKKHSPILQKNSKLYPNIHLFVFSLKYKTFSA